MKKAWALIFALIVACGSPEPLTAPVGGEQPAVPDTPDSSAGRPEAGGVAPDPVEFEVVAVSPRVPDREPEIKADESAVIGFDAGTPVDAPDARMPDASAQDAGTPDAVSAQPDAGELDAAIDVAKPEPLPELLWSDTISGCDWYGRTPEPLLIYIGAGAGLPIVGHEMPASCQDPQMGRGLSVAPGALPSDEMPAGEIVSFFDCVRAVGIEYTGLEIAALVRATGSATALVYRVLSGPVLRGAEVVAVRRTVTQNTAEPQGMPGTAICVTAEWEVLGFPAPD